MGPTALGHPSPACCSFPAGLWSERAGTGEERHRDCWIMCCCTEKHGWGRPFWGEACGPHLQSFPFQCRVLDPAGHSVPVGTLSVTVPPAFWECSD